MYKHNNCTIIEYSKRFLARKEKEKRNKHKATSSTICDDMKDEAWRIKEWQNGKRINSVLSSMVSGYMKNEGIIKAKGLVRVVNDFGIFLEKKTFSIANRQLTTHFP